MDLQTPHLAVEESAVHVYCSADCKTGERPALVEPAEPVSSGGAVGKLLVLGIGIASLSPLGSVRPSFAAAAVANMNETIARESPAPDPAPQLGQYGPAPPTERDLAQQFVAEIADDTWVHPLAGPVRRMPIRTSRVFGAARGGDRPDECRAGHCGVDLGNRWGEPVFAVHDGVVERVQRSAGGNGGRYVRIAHRGGAIVTGYFHLAAIPRRLQAGSVVHRGEIIGVLGETGVEHSAPHLHFAVSVRPDPSSRREVYIDPEPLIALWPLEIPRDEATGSAGVRPGVPLGAAAGARTHRRRHRRSAEPAAVTPAVSMPAAPAPAPPTPAPATTAAAAPAGP